MAVQPVLVLIFACIIVSPAAGAGVAARTGERIRRGRNPIRKVVTMLQDMQNSVEEESQKNLELYDKFQCYCKSQDQSLSDAISNGKSKVDELSSRVTELGATNSQLKQEIEGHAEDRHKAEQQLKENNAIRDNDAAEFAEGSGEMKSNIESLTSALKALKIGGTAMLQTSGFGEKLRDTMLRNPVVAPEERNAVLAFLSTGEGEDADGNNDQIIGVISQILDETKAALADATASEAGRKASSEALNNAKKAEIRAATLAIEAKMDRAGQAATQRVQAKGALAGFEKSLTTDKEMKVSLETQCAAKTTNYQAASQQRKAEMAALSETVKVLNGDDALETFRKSVPAASFLQTSSYSTLKALLRPNRGLRRRNQGRVASAVSSKGFEKVVGMVDGMVNILKESEENDEAKKEHCLLSMKDSEAKHAELEKMLTNLGSGIDEKAGEADDVFAVIGRTKDGIAALDKEVAEVTEQRKEEHAAYVASAASNNAAKDLLKMAANRLNKFYNPSNYISTTPEPDLLQTGEGGIFFAQVHARKQNSAGIFALLADISKAVALKMAEEEHDEVEAQKDYEETLNNAARKRADDAQVIVNGEVTKSETDAQVADLKAERSQKATMLKFTKEKIGYLHRFCDEFLESYEARQKARAAEIDSDKTGQQILASSTIDENEIVEPTLPKAEAEPVTAE